LELAEYSTAALLAELEQRKQSKVRQHSPRRSLFDEDREGYLWKCDTCGEVLNMRTSRAWFADNHWRHGALWHDPCYGRVEKLGEATTYKGALRSQKTGRLHQLLY
jgi:hypothetical protein